MTSIRILPEAIANQIAAGEVIERPANVVKELLENSLDADATHIYIEFSNGGLPLIRVSDDGCGMDDEDACLCFTRHATGKIKHIDDLQTLTSFGFRGEALPSIASVAEVTLRTRRAENELGCEICISAGQSPSTMPCPCPVGTDITVERLFYNVPVRRKFLKSGTTESAHIVHCVRLYALAYPRVHFTLKQDNRLIFSSPKSENLSECINTLWPKRTPSQWLPLQTTRNDWSISGVICPPGCGQATAQMLYVFLNQRPIAHSNLVRALREAYRGFLSDKQYPSAFLFLEMPGTDVDINVHPTKREVRFRQELQVCTFVSEAVRACLTDACRQPFESSPYNPLPIANAFPVSVPVSFCTRKNGAFTNFTDEPKTICPLHSTNVSENQSLQSSTNANCPKNGTGKRAIPNMSRAASNTNVVQSGIEAHISVEDTNGLGSAENFKTDTAYNTSSSKSSAHFLGASLNRGGVEKGRDDDHSNTNTPRYEISENISANTAILKQNGISSNTDSVSQAISETTKEVKTPQRTFELPFLTLWQNRWALFNNGSSLLVLDCKGAQMRLWYDRIFLLLNKEQVGPLQTLLFPHMFFLEDRQAAFFRESIDYLKFRNICLTSAVSDTQFRLEALPQWVPQEQADLFVEQIAASLEYGGQTLAMKHRFEPLLLRLAQKRRFKPVDNERQVRALCNELQTCKNYVTDPLGHPLWNRLNSDDLMGRPHP